MIFSTLGNTGMNFSNLSTEGYAAFILAIIFSIVSIASVIYFLKHQDAKTLIVVLTTMVFPVIAIFCWVYLIMNVFSYPIDISLYVSVGTAVGYLLLAIAIAFIIIACKNAKKRRAEKKANLQAEEVEQESEETPVEPLLLTSSEISEENTESSEEVENSEEVSENEENAEQGVVFANTEKKPFAELLESLDEEKKAYFNEILEYAMSMPNTKRTDSKFHTTVKIGRYKLLDSKFAKETLVCNFMAGSSELKNYSQSEKTVKIKEKPVVLEITSAEAVTVAKNMIDIAYKNITDAHEEKREAKQTQRRRKKSESETETVETTEIQTAETENVESVEETPIEEKPKKRRGRRKKSEIEAQENAETTNENVAEEVVSDAEPQTSEENSENE